MRTPKDASRYHSRCQTRTTRDDHFRPNLLSTPVVHSPLPTNATQHVQPPERIPAIAPGEELIVRIRSSLSFVELIRYTLTTRRALWTCKDTVLNSAPLP
ncbi:hypothetical protein GY45DRAFT_1085709 [Cubamyces sp. BRFM 1775]|nr:hypothetical protein GY45DRAFT_1085709 [Cubamyces sp. BRFM 1775]